MGRPESAAMSLHPQHAEDYFVRLRLKCDGTRAETRFRLSAKRTSPFKSAGASVQSTTSSRVVRISGSNVGYTMFRGSVKGTGYPLHSPVSPSFPLPCVTVCHHVSTGLYKPSNWCVLAFFFSNRSCSEQHGAYYSLWRTTILRGSRSRWDCHGSPPHCGISLLGLQDNTLASILRSLRSRITDCICRARNCCLLRLP